MSAQPVDDVQGRRRGGHSPASTGRTRSAGTDREYLIPGDTVHSTDARQSPSGQRIQPSCSPRYQTPSCSTSTTRGGSNRRESTPATVGADVDRTPKPCLHKLANHQHGDRATYVLDKCRCLPCAAANSVYESQRSRLRAYGRGVPSGLVDAAPVRAHVEQLQAAGMGWKTVAQAAGVAESTLCHVLYGRRRNGRNEPPARRMNPEAARKLLAVPLPTVEQLPGGVVVPAVGTQRRLQALACLGWSIGRLAAEGSLDRQRLDRAMRGQDVVVSTVRAVAVVYDRLWDQRPTAEDRFEQGGITRTINAAKRAGWVPPAAWDDDTIDDPTAVPFQDDVVEDLVDELAVDAVLDGHRMRLDRRDAARRGARPRRGRASAGRDRGPA
jgi:hypothetical protein